MGGNGGAWQGVVDAGAHDVWKEVEVPGRAW